MSLYQVCYDLIEFFLDGAPNAPMEFCAVVMSLLICASFVFAPIMLIIKIFKPNRKL